MDSIGEMLFDWHESTVIAAFAIEGKALRWAVLVLVYAAIALTTIVGGMIVCLGVIVMSIQDVIEATKRGKARAIELRIAK